MTTDVQPGTTTEDIARAAGVAPATVYRHFRDFEALAQACAETAFHIAEIPTPEVAVAPFAHLPSLGEKLMRFIEIDCHCFERAHAWLSAERAGIQADRPNGRSQP